MGFWVWGFGCFGFGVLGLGFGFGFGVLGLGVWVYCPPTLGGVLDGFSNGKGENPRPVPASLQAPTSAAAVSADSHPFASPRRKRLSFGFGYSCPGSRAPSPCGLALAPP